jgi:Flp pilus assembly protein TadG
MPSVRRIRSRGVAAIEFAFVLIGLLALFHGMAAFGSIFYVQQAMTRAAEDGARSMLVLPQGTEPDAQRVRDIVHDALATSLVVPVAHSATMATRRAWVASHVQVTVATAGGSVTVSVGHRYSDNPMLVFAGAAAWLPDLVTRQATIARPT